MPPGLSLLFGLELDGPSAGPKGFEGDYFARQVVGPKGLARRLGTDFGLVHPDQDARHRADLLEHKIRSAGISDTFFSRSFEADSESTCRRLLDIRDHMLMNSTSGFSLENLPDKGRPGDFRYLAESGCFTQIETSLGDFFHRIMPLLRNGAVPNTVESLILREGREALPVLLREAVDTLEAAGTRVVNWLPPDVKAAGDLEIAAAGPVATQGAKAVPRRDGSLILLDGRTPLVSAETIAAMIAALTPEERERTLLIAGGEAGLLEDAFGRFGLPAFGAWRNTGGAAQSQVLPQYFRLLHEGFDPDLLVDYLQNPCSPLDEDLRRALLEALSKYPGLHNGLWRKTLHDWTDTRADREQTEQVLAQWLSIGQVPAAGTISAKRLADLGRHHLAFIEKQLKTELKSMVRIRWQLAWNRAEGLIRALEMRSGEVFTAEGLANFMVRFLKTGQSLEPQPQQGGPVAVQSISAVMRPFDNIVWYNAHTSEIPEIEPPFWTGGEMAVLEKAGMDFGAGERRIRTHFRAAEQTARLARKKLTLVTCSSRSEEFVAHPLRYRLMKAFHNPESAEKKLSLPADVPPDGRLPRALLLGRAHPPVSVREPLYCTPPQTWNLPENFLVPLSRLSASALEKVLSCPLHSALFYQADLRESTMIATDGGVLLLGNIAHEVLEKFVTGSDWTGAELQGGKLNTIIAEETIHSLKRRGAALLRPEARGEREKFTGELQRAAAFLSNLIVNGGYSRARVEQFINGETEIGPVSGILDVQLYKADGSGPAILDLKWGGAGNKEKWLRQNRAIQLAVYSRISQGHWSPTAFYIINIARLLSVHGEEIFPGVHFVGTDIFEKDTWEVITANFRTTSEKMIAGKVEIGLDESEWSVKSPFMNPAPCAYCRFAMICRKGR